MFAPLLANFHRERLLVAHVDGNGFVIGLREADGTPDQVEMPVRQIVREALMLDAAAIILAHNHPSGDPRPSERDRISTRKLAGLGSALGLSLRDHLIFGGDRCSSFRDMGLL